MTARTNGASTFAPAAIVLVCAALAGCANKDATRRSPANADRAPSRTATVLRPNATRTSASSGQPPAQARDRLRGDEDDDDEAPGNRATSPDTYDADADVDSKATQSKRYHDGDDRAVTAWGRAAGPAYLREVSVLVKRYYAAGAGGHAHRACGLLFSLFAEAVPETYGGAAGPGYLRGKTCEAVMSKLFRVHHGKFGTAVTVTGLRVRGNQGRVLLGSKALPASYLTVRRERGVWKVDELESDNLP